MIHDCAVKAGVMGTWFIWHPPIRIKPIDGPEHIAAYKAMLVDYVKWTQKHKDIPYIFYVADEPREKRVL